MASTTKTAGWTKTSVQATKNLAAEQRLKFKAAGVYDVEWPIKLSAERIASPDQSMKNETAIVGQDCTKTRTTTKVIHFQRHGQGYHNLIGDLFRDLQPGKLVLDSKDESINPFLKREMVDSPLTETGRKQCKDRRKEASVLNPELLVVSPLLRAMQTAQLSFHDHKNNIPWVAHEACREELGLLVCNERRLLSEIKEDFPWVDFSECGDDEDTLFNPHQRESPREMSQRIYDFLVNFIRDRPEKEIAVVGHSAWLFNMCNVVMDCGEDENLTNWFLTSEIRSMRVTFVEEL